MALRVTEPDGFEEVDAASKILELQRELERSQAFLANLEAQQALRDVVPRQNGSSQAAQADLDADEESEQGKTASERTVSDERARTNLKSKIASWFNLRPSRKVKGTKQAADAIPSEQRMTFSRVNIEFLRDEPVRGAPQSTSSREESVSSQLLALPRTQSLRQRSQTSGGSRILQPNARSYTCGASGTCIASPVAVHHLKTPVSSSSLSRRSIELPVSVGLDDGTSPSPTTLAAVSEEDASGSAEPLPSVGPTGPGGRAQSGPYANLPPALSYQNRRVSVGCYFPAPPSDGGRVLLPPPALSSSTRRRIEVFTSTPLPVQPSGRSSGHQPYVVDRTDPHQLPPCSPTSPATPLRATVPDLQLPPLMSPPASAKSSRFANPSQTLSGQIAEHDVQGSLQFAGASAAGNSAASLLGTSPVVAWASPAAPSLSVLTSSNVYVAPPEPNARAHHHMNGPTKGGSSSALLPTNSSTYSSTSNVSFSVMRRRTQSLRTSVDIRTGGGAAAAADDDSRGGVTLGQFPGPFADSRGVRPPSTGNTKTSVLSCSPASADFLSAAEYSAVLPGQLQQPADQLPDFESVMHQQALWELCGTEDGAPPSPSAGRPTSGCGSASSQRQLGRQAAVLRTSHSLAGSAAPAPLLAAAAPILLSSGVSTSSAVRAKSFTGPHAPAGVSFVGLAHGGTTGGRARVCPSVSFRSIETAGGGSRRIGAAAAAGGAPGSGTAPPGATRPAPPPQPLSHHAHQSPRALHTAAGFTAESRLYTGEMYDVYGGGDGDDDEDDDIGADDSESDEEEAGGLGRGIEGVTRPTAMRSRRPSSTNVALKGVPVGARMPVAHQWAGGAAGGSAGVRFADPRRQICNTNVCAFGDEDCAA